MGWAGLGFAPQRMRERARREDHTMHFAKRWGALACTGLVYVLTSVWAAAAPTITNVFEPPPGRYGTDSLPSIGVVFSEPVNITGSPTLTVRIGSVERQFGSAYAWTQFNQVVFSYTV